MAKREHVQSSAIRSVGHDPKTRNLDVEFRKGSVYRYSEVSPRVASNLKNASSVGRHFVRNVRNNYDYTRLRKASSRKRGAKGKR